MRHSTLPLFVLAAVLSLPVAAQPVVQVVDAWARATVRGQRDSGVFLQLTARDNSRLVSVASPVAGLAEIHEMRQEGETVRMRALDGLDLPAGRMVDLRPGGYHLMLMNLKSGLSRNASVPLTLLFTDSRGVQSKVELSVPVASSAPGSRPAQDHAGRRP